MLLIVIWSPKQSKIEEHSMESMAKWLEAHQHEELKLWSFIVLYHKQIRNARRGSKEKSNMKHLRGQQLSTTFGALPGAQLMHTICCFEAREVSNPMHQTYAIRSWNEGVRSIGIRLHQAEGQFHGLRNHKKMAAKWCPSRCEISQPSCTPAKFSRSFPIFATDIF